MVDACSLKALNLELCKIDLHWKIYYIKWLSYPQFYIQLVYRAPLFITLKIEIWVSNIRKHDL